MQTGRQIERQPPQRRTVRLGTCCNSAPLRGYPGTSLRSPAASSPSSVTDSGQPSDAPSFPEPATTPEQDLELVRGFLAREPGPTQRFADRLQAIGRIVGCLNRRFGGYLNAHEIDDLAGEATLIALRKADTFPAGAPLDAWLYRISNLEACNAFRRKRKQAKALPEEDAGALDAAVERLEQRELLFKALDQLQRQDAEAVRLHHFDGLTFVEIAARLRLTLNTIKGRYYRGLEQLKTVMTDGIPAWRAQ
jgi:RNA polymerase sigma factor (sigma-70 family)